VENVRLYDPARRPADWTGLIRAGQYAVFATDAGTGAPCDLDGVRPPRGAETCVIVDSIADARAIADAAVARHPSLRLDVFESDGRTRPPLLTVMHPSRAAALETSPAQMRRRQVIAWLLIVAGIPLMVFAYLEHRERDIILPAFLGINMVIIGGRLLWMNLALRETERTRERRLDSASSERQGGAR